MVRLTTTLWDKGPLFLRHHVTGQLDTFCEQCASRLQMASSPVGQGLAVPMCQLKGEVELSQCGAVGRAVKGYRSPAATERRSSHGLLCLPGHSSLLLQQRQVADGLSGLRCYFRG